MSSAYGDRLLYGGSLYSSSPYGGAPDDSAQAFVEWTYHGPRPFHGHEAPTFGRGGLWKRRREAPLGRGGLIVGENERGQYGTRVHCERDRGIYVGQGSFLGHTPGDVENELDQLHGEIMGFSQELIELIKKHEDQIKVVIQKARDEELAALRIVESFQPLVNEVERIEKLLNAAGVDKKTTARWRESIPPYADIVMSPLGKAETLKQQFIAAKAALDKFIPKAERRAAIKRSLELGNKRAELEAKRLGEFPLIQWKRSVWDPFFAGWMKFRGEKKDIPFQMWQLSGTWDRIQDYRKQYVDLRQKAPFKAKGPDPLDPGGRKDPTLTNIFGDIGSILKWTLIGALGIGGAIALSSVVANLRKGRDPVEHYAGVYRGLKRR